MTTSAVEVRFQGEKIVDDLTDTIMNMFFSSSEMMLISKTNKVATVS